MPDMTSQRKDDALNADRARRDALKSLDREMRDNEIRYYRDTWALSDDCLRDRVSATEFDARLQALTTEYTARKVALEAQMTALIGGTS